METTHLRRLAGIALLLAAVLTLVACSGAGDDSGASVDAMARTSEDAPQPAARDGMAMNGAGQDSVAARSSVDTALNSLKESPQEEVDEQGRSIISQGVISLQGDDVEQARFDVQKIVDVHEGEVAEEKTQTDDDGAVSRSRLVVRVPVADFDATMEELEQVAQLESSNRSSEDVTTEVIDTDVRIRAQSESLRRIEILLARAQSIRDIVAIEAQLTRRQADLDSLKSQQAYLADQTSMATITVFLETLPDKAKAEKDDETGFLAGLGSGWHGLKTFTNGVATLIGVLLPFSALLLVVGFPMWVLVRRLALRHRTVVPM